MLTVNYSEIFSEMPWAVLRISWHFSGLSGFHIGRTVVMHAKPLGPTVFALLPSQTGPPHPKGWRCGLGAFSHAYNGGHCKGLRFYPRIVDLSQGRRQRVDGLWRAGRDGNGHTGESSDERSKKTNKTEVQRANCVESRMPDTNQQ